MKQFKPQDLSIYSEHWNQSADDAPHREWAAGIAQLLWQQQCKHIICVGWAGKHFNVRLFLSIHNYIKLSINGIQLSGDIWRKNK